MRLLMFQTQRFWWKSFSKTLESVEDIQDENTVEDAVVVFMHVESRMLRRATTAFAKTLKNVKWLANKRELHACGAALLHPPGRRERRAGLCRCVHHRTGRTATRHGVRGLGDAVRLLQRVGPEGVRREPGQGMEGLLTAQRARGSARSGSTSKSSRRGRLSPDDSARPRRSWRHCRCRGRRAGSTPAPAAARATACAQRAGWPPRPPQTHTRSTPWTRAASAVLLTSTSTTAAWKLAARSATGRLSAPNSRT